MKETERIAKEIAELFTKGASFEEITPKKSHGFHIRSMSG